MTTTFGPAHRPPSTGFAGTSKGGGAHSYLLHDMRENVNSLAYADPGVTYIQGMTCGTTRSWVERRWGLSTGVPALTRWLYLQQGLLWLNDWTRVLRWTLGTRIYTGDPPPAGAAHYRLDALRLYLSANPYTGPASLTWGDPLADFDEESLGQHDVEEVNVSTGLTADSGYRFVESAGSFLVRPSMLGVPQGGGPVSVTLAAKVASLDYPSWPVHVCLMDFTSWSEP